MKITTIAALCAAPLALAGTLDMDLRSRGLLQDRNDIIIATESSQTSSSKGGKDDNSKNAPPQGKVSPPGGNNNADITTITTTGETEVILIWVNEGGGAATSTVNAAAAATANAAAATQTVIVGGTDKVYTPNQITANVGDMVIFEFQAENHTATTSAFTSPCVSNGLFDTGFMPNANGSVIPPPQVGMAVKVATPIWFYCKQKGHCGDGMTFAINPTANKTQAEFEALAIKINGTGSTAGIVATTTSAVVSVAAGSTSVASVVAAPPPAASSSSAQSGLVSGTGTVNSDGSCTCAVVCAAGSIPNTAAQGLSSFGGMGGSIAMSAMEST